jgi:hypothetical protein
MSLIGCLDRDTQVLSLSTRPSNGFLGEIEYSAPVFKDDFYPVSLCCLWEVDAAKCETDDEVKHAYSNPTVAQRLNRLSVPLGAV